MSFHLWEIREVYSSADGSVQFIELFTGAEGQTQLSSETLLRFTEAGTGNAVEFFFPFDLSGSTAGRSLLIGTVSYALLSGVPEPDFWLPDGFLSFAGGTLEILGGDSLSYAAGMLPDDGTHSLVDLNAGGIPDLAVEVNSPANFSGDSGSIVADSEIVGTEGDDNLVGTAQNDTLSGLGGNDTLDGGAGDDLLDGGDGIDTADYAAHPFGIVGLLDNGVVFDGFGQTDTLVSIENLRGSENGDWIVGDANANLLDGGGGDDLIFGGGGDDTLVGGPGTDQLDGGDGDDVFLIGAGADHMPWFGESIDGGTGDDVIRFTSTTPGDLLLLNPVDPNVTGVETVVISDAAGDTSGTTALSVNARSSIGFGLTIVGNDGANFLAGTILDDSIFGNGGDDTLSGGAGDDALDGGAGTDTFIIDGSPGSVTVNLAAGFALDGGGGTDTLAGIENAEGSDNDDTLIGDGGANRLRGLAGNDRLEGGAGDDLLDGGDGIDTADYGAHFASIVADLVSGTVSDGFDTDTLVSIENLRGSQASDFLQGDAGANRLDGGDGGDFIAGGGGGDTLVGGPGTDVLDGGDGDDVFLIGAGADHELRELISGGAGTDVIRFTSTTPGDFFFPDFGWFPGIGMTGVEMVVIGDAAGDTSGTTALNVNARFVGGRGLTIVGNDGANFLGGTVYADSIFGNGGDDMLHGGSGDDTLDGGAGTDTLISFTAGGPVTVDLAAGFALDGEGGTDTLIGIENADGSDNTDDTLIGDAGANVLRGLSGNDLLEGGAGNDLLDGGAGADTMLGGPGDDTYVLDDEGDAIEESPNAGTDTVLSSVSTELRNHLEHLTLTGTASSGTGNRLDNVLTGNDAANVLRGMAGDDTLRGGPGNDVLGGGGGEDSFVFADAPGPADADLVTDFRSGQDELRLDDAAFAAIGALGPLDDERFAFGDGLTAGADAADRILYDTAAGDLYYDADGSGAGAALLFATLQGAPGLNAGDILVI